jgi:hypothetical protein
LGRGYLFGKLSVVDEEDAVVEDGQVVRLEAGRNVGVVGEYQDVTEDERQGGEAGDDAEAIANALPEERRVVSFEGSLRDLEEVLLNLHQL